MEFGDFAMLRRMLRGIKARAESMGVLGNQPPVPTDPDGLSGPG
jgi:hypothetical protein